MTYRLVIFDFDGTLADSRPWFESVLNAVGERYGFRRIEPSEREHLRRLDARQLLAHLGVPRWKLPLIARHMRALKAESLDEISLFPGVGALLRQLTDAGLELAIVSSDTEANIRRVLGPENVPLVADFACSASLFGKGAHVRRVLRRAGLRPDQALAIGDEIRDAEAARANGVAFAAVAWGYAAPDALAPHAETVFRGVADIARHCLREAPDRARFAATHGREHAAARLSR